ncbi:amidohydrolase [Frankia sp. CNm7]|uniref:Amidohydrolase n=1 Tax=Frankia nepalensis TaxID=1836974 RepID=A0A937RNM3_9ACTN|nr:amidohydrolase family protein [Frankia nepalensis]MBL7502683.1 amidohydrolase [Frankia nepalensis]MBL7515034.1 amidohydrolase [Frankia nepalensis]MBL7518717.1 amidohydrolase [Frankia nepalensis]MBL7629156.1 amidohydrolase [Frankia nepalensis]
MASEASGQDVLSSYHIIDGDAHWTEPPDLWTSRAPASLKGRLPYVKRVNGRDHWFIENGESFGHLGTCIIDQYGVKHRGIEAPESQDVVDADVLANFKDPSRPTFDDVHAAAYDAKARVKLLDELGLWAQIVYPNAAGLATMKFMNDVRDADLRLALVQIYNDAIAEWQQESGGRLLPQAILPFWDQEALEREARRAVEDLGLHGLVISDKPEQIGLPNFTTSYWAGFWDFCASTGTPVNFHVGGNLDASPIMKMPWDSFGPEAWMAITAPLFAMGSARTIMCFIYSGILDKYPGLKLVSVESGIGWVPYFLEAMEYQLDEMMPNEGKALRRRPKEYFRDHFYTTFWFEREALKNLEAIGPGNILVETDYPHPTCLYPHREHFASVFQDVKPEYRRRILQDNAAELYRVALPEPATV